jgi:diguanylate cyclase (GGDEF)-like protein
VRSPLQLKNVDNLPIVVVEGLAGQPRGFRAIEDLDEHDTLRAVADRRGTREIGALAVLGGTVVGGLAVSGALDSLAGAIGPGTLAAVTATSVVTAGAAGLIARRRHREAVQTRRQLVRIALHDPLTDLPNRNLLHTWVAAEIVAAQQRGSQAAVVMIDLARFKHVNDAYGHKTGDLLMKAVADRLRSLRRPGDRVIRVGGDEFALLCSGANTVASIEKLARRVVHLLEQPFTIENQVIRISASVGAALAEHRGVSPDDVLRDAEIAKHQASARGPGNAVVFDRSQTSTATPAAAAKQIREAFDARQLHLHYQPVVDLRSGRIVGAEALLRWNSPTRGMVPPSDFVPILEETGLIVPVGTWVLREACEEAARLTVLLGTASPMAITINVSARQLNQDGFAELVADTIAHAGVSDGQIHLEITEGALMHDVDAAWAVLRQAKALGVKLDLDDFGTGYSSLSYVRRFSLDMLKIDKSFIDGLDTSPEDRAIVEHLIGMADALGMVTVAEGVERPEQLAWLRRMGCRLAQGFALSRPLSATDLESLVLRRRDDPYKIDSATEPVDLDGPDLAELERLIAGPTAGGSTPPSGRPGFGLTAGSGPSHGLVRTTPPAPPPPPQTPPPLLFTPLPASAEQPPPPPPPPAEPLAAPDPPARSDPGPRPDDHTADPGGNGQTGRGPNGHHEIGHPVGPPLDAARQPDEPVEPELTVSGAARHPGTALPRFRLYEPPVPGSEPPDHALG